MEGENFTTKESTELLQHIAKNMVTREDVDQIVSGVVGKAKTEIMDYVDKKDREYKGDLNLKIRKEDYRVDAVISTLRDKNVIDDKKAIELKKLSPFPQTN
jgi:hypothetical protein